MSYYRFPNNKGLRLGQGGAFLMNFGEPIIIDPPEPVEGGKLWAGLGGSADWDRDNLPMNVMRMVRPWTGNTAGGWGQGTAAVRAVLDANGYPQSMPSGVTEIVAFFLNAQATESGATLNGRYRFTYDGVGTFNVQGSSISNLTRPSAGVIEFDYTANGQESSSYLTCSAITQGNHPRNMKMFQIRYAERMEQGFMTRPDFEWGDLAVLRFMDLQQTNHHHELGHAGVGTWAKKDYYTWNEKGIPFEDIVTIANELQINPWVCIPHTANDAYVQHMAEVFRDGLDPALKCYVEWSNETWNFGFAQTGYCVDRAAGAWGGNGTSDAAWYQWAGMRAAQCMNIFSSVFAGQTQRIVRTAGMFLSWEGLEYSFMDAPLSTAMGNPAPHLSFDAYAISGYFGNNLTDDTYRPQLLTAYNNGGMQAAINFAMNYLRSGNSVESSLAFVYDRWAYHRGVCNTRNLDLVMYEGGTHIVALQEHVENDLLTNILIGINYSPEMGDIYREALTKWDEYGDGGFNHFVTIGRPSKHGSWGGMRWAKDNNSRAVALMEYNGESQPPVGSVPSVFGEGSWSLSPTLQGFMIFIDVLPANNGSPITSLQYRVNGGAATNLPGTGVSAYNIAAAQGVTVDVEVRAVNSIGSGSWSTVQTTTTLVDDGGSGDGPLRVASTASTRSIHSGHSLTDAYFYGNWPGNLPQLRNSLMDPDDTDNVYLAKSTIPGSPLVYRWDNSSGTPDARRDIEDFDTLMITEGGPPPKVGTQWMPNTLDYLCRFVANAIENGVTDIVLWSIWPALNGPGTNPEQPIPTGEWAGFTFRTGLNEYLKSFKYLADYATWKMKQLYPQLPSNWRVWMFPGDRWMARVYDDITNGLVPGITNIAELFADDIHPNDTGIYGLSSFVFASLYQLDLRNQAGLYAPSDLPTALRNYFWDIAWELATTNETVGMGGTQNGVPEWTLAGNGDPLPNWSLTNPGV